jgi:lipid A 3-O-deacylase
MRGLRALAVLGAVLSVPTAAEAQQGFREAERSFLFSFENDVFDFLPDQNDDAYTQGLRLLWTVEWLPGFLLSPDGGPSRWDPRPPRACDSRVQDGGSGGVRPSCGTLTFGFGQTIFTPDDLLTTERLLNDRPYGAWFFGVLGMNVRRELWSSDEGRAAIQSLASLTSYLGVTGELSAGRELQNFAHWTFAFGAPRVMGWDNQLATGLQVNGVASYRPRMELCSGDCAEPGANRYFEVVVPLQGEIGTLMNRGSLGGSVRVGRNLPAGFGVERLPVVAPPFDPSEPDPGAPPPPPSPAWWQQVGFGGGVHGEARHVWRNAFIEGSYRDVAHGSGPAMHDVRAAARVYEYGFTLLLRPVPRAHLAYHAVWRTSEIEGRDRPDSFGILQFALQTR